VNYNTVLKMVNLYNASNEALAEMRAGNYHHVKLEIEHSSNGGTRWIFTKIPEGFLPKAMDALHTYIQTFTEANNPNGPAAEFKFGDEIRPFHEKAEAFHQKLERGVHKAAQIGNGLSKMQEQGISGCVQDDDYWCETIHSSHVSKAIYWQLNDAYELAVQKNPDLEFDVWIQSDQALDFLQFKEGTRDISDFQVRYLSNEERAQHRVEFRKEGKDTILYYQGTPLNTELFETEAGTGRAIFVIGPDHELYAGNHEYFKFHHTSFFGGRPVIGAGEVITDPNGKLIAITDKSGHYKPNKKQLWDSLAFLKDEKHVNLDGITLIRVPRNQAQTGRYNAMDYYESRGTCKPAPNEHEDYR